MRFAINIPNFGDFADPRLVADLARRTEEAGWDGLFVWDHVTHHKELRREIADPWVLLTAAALATSRIRLGTMITPVARRRVAKLAREVTTLDRLTGGRMILGVGLGAPLDDEYGTFGEPTDARLLAARLDESLFAMNELWSGVPVTFHGQHIIVNDVAFAPVPVQRPRVPIWVGGNWPAKRPMRRAARWDGAVPIRSVQGPDPAGDREPPQPDAAFVREVHGFLSDCRAEAGHAEDPFDLLISGTSTPKNAAEIVGPLAAAGATWWQECAWRDRLERAEPMLQRIESGPPPAMDTVA
jgi:alkanesulfonate monooxygenase SsuD/methylene tetrahydromethanopterin reductase-like flavin-dependent oxidoreductase (luciferase family)